MTLFSTSWRKQNSPLYSLKPPTYLHLLSSLPPVTARRILLLILAKANLFLLLWTLCLYCLLSLSLLVYWLPPNSIEIFSNVLPCKDTRGLPVVKFKEIFSVLILMVLLVILTTFFFSKHGLFSTVATLSLSFPNFLSAPSQSPFSHFLSCVNINHGDLYYAF